MLWPGALTSLTGFKKEIKKNEKWVKLYIVPVLLGAIVGSVALINTPSSLFYWIAPILIILGSILMQFRENINNMFVSLKLTKDNRLSFSMLLIFIISAYGSYFGAGIGILLLGALSILGIKNIYENIAIKNVLAIIANFVALVVFVFAGFINWHFVPVMVVGAIIGGYTGSHLIRKVNQRLVRDSVIGLGYVMAILLFLFRIH